MGLREIMSQNRRSAFIGGALLLAVGGGSVAYQMATYRPDASGPPLNSGTEDDDAEAQRRADFPPDFDFEVGVVRDREARFREHQEEERAAQRAEQAATRVAHP